MSNRFRVGSGNTGGFTIVELMIVVVVIGILASITISSYAGTQDRAKNTAIIDTASSVVKMIQAYAATNSAYPSTTNTGFCITTGSVCVWTSTRAGDATFDTNIATVGNAPKNVPTVISSTLKGIFYYYDAARTMNGKVQPVYIVYHLKGSGQQCGVPGVSSTTGSTMTSSTTGYTENNTWNGAAMTVCYVSVPGPTS